MLGIINKNDAKHRAVHGSHFNWFCFDVQLKRKFSLVSVILARILRKSNRRINHNEVYKIEVKKAYKVSIAASYQVSLVVRFLWFIQNESYEIDWIKCSSQKSPQTDHFLREGRLLTPTSDGMCGGLSLKVGKLYLIAGNSQHINICNYVKEYSQMTIVERRGFAGGYKKGCACEVSYNFENSLAWFCVNAEKAQNAITIIECFR